MVSRNQKRYNHGWKIYEAGQDFELNLFCRDKGQHDMCRVMRKPGQTQTWLYSHRRWLEA